MSKINKKKLDEAMDLIYISKVVGKTTYDPKIHFIPNAVEEFEKFPTAKFGFLIIGEENGAVFHQFADGSRFRVA
jgi:hypothetical protein